HGPSSAIQLSADGASAPVAASWNTISQTRPISIKPQNNTTNHTLDGPALTLTGVRFTALAVKSLFLRTLDLGIFDLGETSELRYWRASATTSLTHSPAADGGPMAMRIPRLLSARDRRDAGSSPSVWRVGVPVVCLLAGLLLGATHGVSRGGEIRRSDAPRLVDLVRSEQSAVARLTTARDRLAKPTGCT